MIQRTWWPRLNPNAQLAKGLVFAGLGGGASTLQYADASGYGNHGTLTNMDPATDWVFDPTLGRFVTDHDGSQDYISIPVIPLAAPCTLACWIKPANNTANHVGFGLFGTADGHKMYICANGAKAGDPVEAVTYRGSWGIAQSASAYTVGAWNHIAGTFVSDTARYAWLNGVAGSKNVTSANPSTYLQMNIGRYYGWTNNYANAQIGDCLAWKNRLLSSEELKQLADPSNTLLSGLILPPRRVLFPAAVVSGGIVLTRHFTPLQLFQNTI